MQCERVKAERVMLDCQYAPSAFQSAEAAERQVRI